MLPVNTYKIFFATLAVLLVSACSLAPHKPSGQTVSSGLQMTMGGEDYQRALNSVKAGKLEDALHLFNATTKAHPEFAPSYINIGLIEIKRDNLHTAETALLHAAKLAPQQPEIFNGLGIIYRRMGRFDDAETAYLKALQIAPNYAKAQLNIGILYDIYMDNLNAALDHYERYQEITGGDNQMVAKWVVDVRQRINKNIGSAR